MQIKGHRRDGALYVDVGGGVAVILSTRDRRWVVSPPSDSQTIGQKYGPWLPPDNSFSARQQMQKHLQQARLRPIGAFMLSFEGMSFDERRQRVNEALGNKLGYPSGGYGSYPMSVSAPYIPENGLGEDWVVYCLGSKYYGWSYDIDETTGQVTFIDQPEEVVRGWDTITERAAEDTDETAETELSVQYRELAAKSEFFKRLMARKKAKKLDDPSVATGDDSASLSKKVVVKKLDDDEDAGIDAALFPKKKGVQPNAAKVGTPFVADAPLPPVPLPPASSFKS